MRRQSTSSTLTHLLVVVAIAGGASAERPPPPSLRVDLPLSEQLHRDYYLRDGLPSNWINDVVQTQDGYIWIATDNGVVRYDGLEFKTFNPAITPQLPFNEIRVLHESRDGSLWIGTTAGLTRYRPGRPGRFEEIPAVSGKIVRAIYEDRDHTLWIGTGTETYVSRRGGEFEILPDAPKNVLAYCEDHQGRLWIGSHNGLFRRQGTEYQQITHERLPARTSKGSGVSQSRVNSILVDDDGSLWIGTNRTLLHIKDSEFTPRGQEIEAQQIYDIVRTLDGGLYVAARFGVFRSVGDGPFEVVGESESAFTVMEDREGGIWIGHGDNRGLHHYRTSNLEPIWTENRVRCAYDDGEGNLWFGSSNGLHRLRDGVITDYGLDDGLPDLRVQSITKGGGNTLWIGTGKGFVNWTGAKIVPAAGPAELAELNVGAAMEDTTGVLWFSLASSGGFSLQDGKLNQLQTFEGKRIHWFWEDPNGMIWVGHESGLYQRRDGRFQRVDDRRMDRLKSPRFLCHFAAADGTLWMGTSNGIVRYRSGRFDAFAPEDGLRADNIERLVADHQGNLWFGGRDGLFRSRISELNDFADGHLESVASYRVEGFERFPPINAFSQGCLLRNEALYIVGEQGLIRLPIGPFQREAMPPPVRIEQAIVDEVPASFERPFEFLSGQRRLSIQYAVPAFVNPHHTQVKYRLDQHDDRWIDSGSSRTAHYTNLPPGDYRFRVAARSGNQPWVEADPAMSFTVLPRWWERTWLRVATVLMTVVAGLGYIQYRIRRLRRSNAALRREINERKRAEEQSRNHLAQLARVSRAASMGELTTSIAHEVKQPLFAIVSNAQTARRLLDRDEPDIDEVRDALHDIADDGNRASNIIDRVRSLVKKERHPTHDLDLNEVARDASNFAELEMRNRGFVIETEFATDLPLVRANPIELQQVILNLLINGAQSMIDTAPASRLLTMRTSATGDSVELAVEDRGVGLHEGTLEKLFEPFFTTKPQGTGMGLAINRTIIEAHDGRIWATQNPDRGLTFHFSLPAGQKSRPHDNISGNSREASL